MLLKEIKKRDRPMKMTSKMKEKVKRMGYDVKSSIASTLKLGSLFFNSLVRCTHSAQINTLATIIEPFRRFSINIHIDNNYIDYIYREREHQLKLRRRIEHLKYDWDDGLFIFFGCFHSI